MDISHPSSGMRKKYHYFLTLTRHAINQLPRQQICSSFFLQKEYLLAKKKKKYCPSSIYMQLPPYLCHTASACQGCNKIMCTFVLHKGLGRKKQKAKIHVVITHFQSFYINKVITSQTMLMNVLTLRQKLAKFENYLNGSCKIKNQTWIPNCYSTAATECTTSYTLIVTAHLLSCIL